MTPIGADAPRSPGPPLVAVLDASAVVARVSDEGDAGEWVVRALAGARSAGPELMPFEAANVLRRLELRGALDPERAAEAHDDLLDLEVEAYPYWALADRTRELRADVTTHDAAHVAVAELIGGVVITLDERLARAPGPRCPVLTPGDATAG